MNEFIDFDHRALMQLSFLLMFSLNLIIIGYYIFSKRTKNIKYMILGNTSYTLFFMFVSLGRLINIDELPVLVAILDLSAVIFWMMAINDSIEIKQPKKQYLFWSLLNILIVFFVLNISSKVSTIRSATTLIIVVVLSQATYQLLKNIKAKEFESFKFTTYTMLLFTFFKFLMTLYRIFSIQFESGILSIELSINVLTFTSLVFAIWLNFAVAYLNYDILKDEIKELGLKDYLTKLPNRRMLMERVEYLLELHKRKQSNFALIILDLDDFKKVNDKYGHNIGDEVLIDFADLMYKSIRSVDMAGRYGGEEFLMLLEVDSVVEAKVILERMFDTLNSNRLSSKKISLTASGGFVMIDDNVEFTQVSDITFIADRRLYLAKTSGKNKLIYEG